MSKSIVSHKSEIIARKTWSNAKAFIYVNMFTREIRVESKFYDDGRAHHGPTVTLKYPIPFHILDDVKEHLENGWKIGSQSEQLADYIQKIWIDAKAEEDWFTYPV
jgi:hypothetical protein